MTKDLFTSLETFLRRLRQAHPTLDVGCDAADSPNGSTWIDIKAGKQLFVVEYRPDLGFGFSDYPNEDGQLYGTPSSFFVDTADEALVHLDLMLVNAADFEGGGTDAARRGA